MKKILLFLTILAVFSACSSGKQKNDNHASQTADTILTEAVIEKPVAITYIQCTLAYLVNGELYFYNVDDNKKVKFIEESDTIFNFTFDKEGKTLYYNVVRDGSLWLKAADISDSKITPHWVADWELKKDDCMTDTYGEMSPLFYYKGELIIRHNFIWDSYDFNKMAIYSILKKNITRKGFDYSFLSKAKGELPLKKSEQYFKTIDENLYYTRNNIKVCLTEKLDFEMLRNKEDENYWVETEFNSFILSPDETKILYGTMIEMGDLGHGPYSVANADGTNQMVLDKTDIASSKTPVWLKNNIVAFTDNEGNLFVTNNDDSSVQKIAENVSLYVGR